MVSRINLQGFCQWFYRLVFKGFFGMSQELTRVCNGFLEYLSRFIQGFFFSSDPKCYFQGVHGIF